MFVSCGKKSNFIRFSPLLMILQHIMTSPLQLSSIKFCLNLLFQQSLILLSVFSLFFFPGSAQQHDPPGAHQVSASGVAVV